MPGLSQQRHRFYNAGDRIQEVIHYSLPDGHDIHCVAKWQLDAPEKEFFFVPSMLEVNGAQIFVQFADLILREDRFGKRGVVLVDKNWEAPASEEEAERIPMATSDQDAISKANRILERHEKELVQQFIDQCNMIRTKGNVPVASSGYTKKLLKKYGVVDPSEAVLIKPSQQSSDLEELKETVRKQQEMIEQLLAGGGKSKTAREKSATG